MGHPHNGKHLGEFSWENEVETTLLGANNDVLCQNGNEPQNRLIDEGSALSKVLPSLRWVSRGERPAASSSEQA
jgi:hypothetical protein